MEFLAKIFGDFSAMEIHEIIAQIFGYCGVAISILIYAGKTRAQILICKFISDTLWFVNLILIAGYTGALLNLIAMGREIVFYNRNRKAWAGHRIWFFVFLVLTLLSPVFEWVKIGELTWIPLLPAVGSIFAVVSFYSNRPAVMRYFGFAAQAFWLIYAFMLDNKSSIVCGILTILSAFIGLVRDLIAKRRSNTKPDTESP